MKSIILSKSLATIILIQIVLAVIFISNCYSQLSPYHPLAKMDHDSSDIFQYENLTHHTFGIKYFDPELMKFMNYVPRAKFHIFDNVSYLPLFQVEAINYYASIKNLLRVGSTVYGIYQSGPVDGLNFFENKILIGSAATSGTELLKINGDARICNDLFLNEPVGGNGFLNNISTIHAGWVLNFDLAPAPQKGNKSLATILSLDYLGIKTATVHGNLITETFQMTTTPGQNKVLVSDRLGNGSWTDISSWHDDDWLPIGDNPKNLYLNSIYTNVGIGTIKPIDKLQVNDGPEKIALGSAYGRELNYGNGYIGFNAARQKKGDDFSWLFNTDGAGTNGGHNGGSVMWSDMGGNIYFATVPSTDPGNYDQPLSDADIKSRINMTMFSDGKVAIGTDHRPGNHTLYVKGGILAEEVKVQLIGNWSDYVFSPEYKIITLRDLEIFINKNHHLPEVPTENEVKSDGVDVGKMNSLLLKKVEELTLYIIEQQKQIDELKNRTGSVQH